MFRVLNCLLIFLSDIANNVVPTGLRKCRYAFWCWSLLQDFEGSMGESFEVVGVVLKVMIWYSGFVRAIHH